VIVDTKVVKVEEKVGKRQREREREKRKKMTET
jgi:hypothetical protein